MDAAADPAEGALTDCVLTLQGGRDEASELAQEELDVGGRRGLRHHPPGHLADAASHEERRLGARGAQTEGRRPETGLTGAGLGADPIGCGTFNLLCVCSDQD